MRPFTRLSTFVVAVVLAGAPFFAPGVTGAQAAQDDPAPAPAPSPAPAPGRQPTFRSEAPAGALRLAGSPPSVGAVILDDSLAGPGIIPGRLHCPTGKNLGEFVGEGYIFKVTGRCVESLPMAFAATPPLADLQVPDGEIRLEAKVVSGHDRALLIVLARSNANPPRGYTVLLVPSLGAAQLQKEEGSTVVPLARRFDLAGRLSRDGWNDLAIRLDGENIWVLLGEEPILSASDASIGSGTVAFGVGRGGELDDSAETAAVYRNLRVSDLAR